MVDAYLNDTSLAYAENFVIEDAPVVAARGRADELGCVPVSPASGAVLRLLASVIGARAVVEVGGGAGVSGLFLLEGMRSEGVLTSIDTEAEHQRAAKLAFAEAGIASTRYRMINSAAAEVLPRLTDGAYDLVFVDADKTGYPGYFEQAVRLLRRGGLVAFDNMLWHDRVADPSRRDAETVALRELSKTIRDDERVLSALISSGDGLMVAQRL
jgi:predicted O-methyltransferase YrrM